jgi:DNA-binding transcriptional LysR family regulator
MAQQTLNDRAAFVRISRERSFTSAAAKLGVSQSALSQTLRALEARLGVRLLTRTTRSVSPTEAGERLLQSVGPRLEEIKAELEAMSEFRDRPAGRCPSRQPGMPPPPCCDRSWRSSSRNIRTSRSRWP